jgi:exodeoxyribonuclease-3
MILATWNVNSVRTRLDRLVAWLAARQPDILCVQELKVTDDAFPYDAIREAGYKVAVYGQKTYNGVAILSKAELATVVRGLADDVDDPQARLIAADVGGIRILNAYVPNGGEVGAPKWAYKLQWMKRLRDYLDGTCDSSKPVVLCGDMNIAPDDRDVARPGEWADSVLCHREGRAALEHICDWGLVDVFRKHHPAGGVYSWWDYRMLAFPKNNGLRIDHILATEALAARCTSAEIDRDQRKGQRPSDHAPVLATFEDK